MAVSENMCFEKNISLLKKNHPEVFEIISGNQEPSVKTKLVLAENQKPNLKVKISENEDIFIHDHEDPGIESETFLSMISEHSTGVVLMFGMGLGYSVLELLRKRKKLQYLIVFELNVEFFIHAIKNMDLAELFMDKRVIFCLGEPGDLPSVMAPANRALSLEDIHTLNLQTCFKVNPAYEKISSIVFDYINAFNSEGATKTIHGRTFFENRLKHMTSMHHDKKFEDLAGRFKGVPALIIAAGPSLDKNIDQIFKAIGKAVIISVDTALPNLLNQGIRPDFVTSIDYKELTYEKISGVAADPAARQINLICTSWVTDIVPKIFPAKNVFWAYANNALENWINISMGGKMAIGGAGTVAHLNFISAKIMGCDPIIFVGQDLAFSNNRGHSSNVVLTSDDTIKKMLNQGQDIMWVKGVVEPKVPTNRQMHGYKHTFEQMIKESGGNIINATEGGALIEGAKNMSLVQAIDRFCKDNVIIDINHVQGQANPLQTIESTIKNINTLEKILLKADKLAGPLEKKLINQKKAPQKFTSFSSLPEKVKSKITNLDACHNKADKSHLWPLFDEMTMEGLRQNEREKKELETLEGVPDKYLDWLLKSIKRIDKINTIRMTNIGRFKRQLNELTDYYTTEKSLLKKVKKDEVDLNDILELAKIYYKSGNYVLLEKMLDRYASGLEGSAKVHYYYGVIALYQGDHETAENRFQSALNCDGAYAKTIDQKRKEIADYYVKLAKSLYGNFLGSLNPIAGFLLLKGLKCRPDHTAIKNEFRRFAEDDLAMIKQSLEEKKEIKSEFNKSILGKWINFIDREEGILGCLKKDIVHSFYLFYGKILVDEKKYQNALNHYQKALSIMPDNPDIYISLADICFAVEDFDSGLQYLKTAVNLDKKYAIYWHNMGKNLQAQNDFNGAILAYEQYFLALPENITVLKDIGDCHKRLGNLEAAHESYRQLKKILNK